MARVKAVVAMVVCVISASPVQPQGDDFDPLLQYPNMGKDYIPHSFPTQEANHLQYFQDADDHNEWKWETTQVEAAGASARALADF
jgi:hypothetical protein